ncbi:phage holin family protein [Limnobaculum xujianqingii]|uniref:phage holin family protein n=1 Tax=Limnobaculum xujianqingii TaxID=2738837 RepID=UPI0015BE8256|nr:phage holin family protein [Limnobaculum xujianqingii]
MRMPWKNETTLIAALMTLFGAMASYAHRVLNGQEFSFKTLTLQVLISIFAGAMVVLAANYYKWDPEVAGGVAGVAGWAGAELIKVLEKILINRIKRLAGDDN